MSSEAPFPCPSGYVWDGKKFFKLPPNLARVSETSPGPSRAGSKPSGYPPKVSRNHNTTSGVAESSNSSRENVSQKYVRASAFQSTPARPSPYFYGTSDWARELPRNLPPSSAAALRWKKSQICEHVNNMVFYSRDSLHPFVNRTGEGPNPYVRHTVRKFWHSVEKAQYHEATGSLLWLTTQQSQSVHEPEPRENLEVHQLGSIRVDTAGRLPGRDRDLFGLSADHRGDEVRSGALWYYTNESLPHRTAWAGGTHALNRPPAVPCALPVVITGAPVDWFWPLFTEDISAQVEQDVIRVQYQFHFQRDSTSLRGIEIGRQQPRMHSWSYPAHQSMVTRSNLNFSAAVFVQQNHDTANAPSIYSHENLPGLGDALITVAADANDRGPFLRHLCLHSSSVAITHTLPRQREPFSAAAIADGSGLCWVGYHNGDLTVLNTLAWLSWETRLEEGSRPSGSWHGHQAFSRNYRHCGAVTNLFPLLGKDVIAIFSRGSILRLRFLDASKLVQIMEYKGHVNEGTTQIVATLHPPSQLLAVRGTDKTLRIWHLADEYPLNSLWHSPRLSTRQLNIEISSPNLHERLLGRSKESAAQHPFRRSKAFMSLVHENMNSVATQVGMSVPLASQEIDASTIAFVPTSWAADRDAVWELSRDFDEVGCSRLIGAGLFPGLAIACNHDSTLRILYYQPRRTTIRKPELRRRST